MVDIYKIHLVNQQSVKKPFWCFLAPPEELAGSEVVFANSNTWLNVLPPGQGSASFGIPVQYKFAATNTNKAIGLKILVQTSSLIDVNLSQVVNATFAPPSEKTGGVVILSTDLSVDPNQVAVKTNIWDKAQEGKSKWYSGMSFGMETESGFIGMTWSPDPNETRTITPKIEFYVSTGDFGENNLASWTTVNNKAATVNQFSAELEATVTLGTDGVLTATPGAPTALNFLPTTDRALTSDQVELSALTYISLQQARIGVVSQVALHARENDDYGLDSYVTGEVKVSTQLEQSFPYFVSNGITFEIGRTTDDGDGFYFSYRGPLRPDQIEGTLKPGSTVLFGGRRTQIAKGSA